MKIETYELTGPAQETEQQSAEALALCESLGLKGQFKETSVQTKTRNPYRLLHDDEMFVYNILCPEHNDVHTFANEPIPLEILKTLAFAKSLDQFAYFEVWSASSKTVKDPVLVAYEKRYDNKPYLLARWGEELLPLEVLIPDALKKWWAARRDALKVIGQQVAAELTREMPETIPTDSRRTIPVFYV